jgi:hypothetical protein
LELEVLGLIAQGYFLVIQQEIIVVVLQLEIMGQNKEIKQEGLLPFETM